LKRINNESAIGRKYCRPDMTVKERLEHVGWAVTPTGCWEWNGGKHSQGYGVLNVHGRSVYPHREMLQIKLGRQLGKGMFACHTCDNPPCMNPEHLFEGTLQDNNKDMHNKGRASGGRTGGGKITYPKEVFDLAISMRLGGHSVPDIREATGMSKSYIYSLFNGFRSVPKAYKEEK
jgi:hypothetical protein